MKAIQITSFFILVLAIASFQLNGQSTYKVVSSEMTISGTSNVHDWTSSVNSLKATGDIRFENSRINNITNFIVTIPVQSIKSTKGKIMDNKTYDALEAKQHPNITFQLTSATYTNSINAKGYLTIAGTKKSINLTVKPTVASNGTITFVGSQKINMKDYGITPPTALLGAMTTGEYVTIAFKISLMKDTATSLK